MINPCAPVFALFFTPPTHPHLSSPLLSLPTPSLQLSIRIACVWILMLITPRLKIAIQSVISPRNLLTTHTHAHTHTAKEGITETSVCCAPQQELKSGEWSLWNCFSLFLTILPSNAVAQYGRSSMPKWRLAWIIFWHQPTIQPESLLMGLMLLYCGRWGNTLWICGLVRTVKCSGIVPGAVVSQTKENSLTVVMCLWNFILDLS